MADEVQQIKDRLNIVDVIGQYVKLSKAGKNYKGLSPFRTEKTPSFFVSPDKGMYYDFSSGQGGDIFTFIQEMEGVDFRGALTVLAERAGIELKRESKATRDARERLYEIVERSCQFFEAQFADHEPAREYLKKRGLEDATVRSFRVGFAPDSWQDLRDHLVQAGYSEREVERAGMIKRGERGSYYDRFRSRITFPIMDAAGRPVAFSGRVIGAAAEDKENAKYLNSPETPLFDKGRILFGYNKAKQFIRRNDFAILVEGQMDLVMSHQAGFPNTIAASGTGLTDDHLLLIDRLTKRLVLAFDADEAGIASSGRAAVLALRRGMDVKVAHVPLGKDPADCILEDPASWKGAVREAKHIVDYLLDVVLREQQTEGYDERKLLLRVRDMVLPYIALIQSGVDQAHFVRSTAQLMGIAEDAVWQDVRAAARKARQEASTATHATPAAQQQAPSAATHSRKEALERAIAGFLFWQEGLEDAILNEEHVTDAAKICDLSFASMLARYTEEREQLAFQAEVAHENVRDGAASFRSLCSNLCRIQLEEERERLTRELKTAERGGDTNTASELLERVQEIAVTLGRLES
jgi:DNA primase